MLNLALIDYGSGNLHSARKALVRAAEMADIPARVDQTSEPDRIAAADRIVLPGVGAFGACMASLQMREGVVDAMAGAIRQGTPFLGICVGMQLLASKGLEHGEHEGLGWIEGTVRPLKTSGLKIPHMGWNEVIPVSQNFCNVGDAYFVHSYCFEPDDENVVAATCDYGEKFAAAVSKDNIMGVQFHPEKSQSYGLAFLGRFLKETV